MSKDGSTVKMARPAEPEAVRTTIVGGRPPGGGAIPRDIPRGLEILIKKAAVDPAFKDILFEKRAGAAKAIGLELKAAEEAMLAAVPLPQLEGIIAHTRISPKLKPVFLGYAAGAMLAALGTATLLSDSEMPQKGQPNAGAASYSKKRAKGQKGYPGAVLIQYSGSGPYAFGVGGGGGGGGTGMRGDRPGTGYVTAIISSGGSAGMRVDRVAKADRGREKPVPSKTRPERRRTSPGHYITKGIRVDIPEESGPEQPASYVITFDSPAVSRRSYRSAASIRDYIGSKLAGIQHAYDAAVEENPSLGGGKITARFTVDPRGRVVAAEIAEDTLGDDSLRSSILSRVRSWKFPAAGQADVTVEYPFVFIAEEI